MTQASMQFAGVAIVALLVIIKALRSPMDWKNWVILSGRLWSGCASPFLFFSLTSPCNGRTFGARAPLPQEFKQSRQRVP